MNIDNYAFTYALNTIKSANSQRQLGNLLFELRDLYQIDNVVYHAAHIDGSKVKNPILLLTYDHQWVQEYTRKNLFEIDPVVVSGRQANLPLDWSEVDRETSRARQFFKEADSYGVGRQGYTMPIRTHPDDTVLFTFTSNVKDDEWRAFRAKRKAELLFIGQQFHEKIVSLSGLRQAAERPDLTPQELRCIQYLVLGLSPKSIARNLDLSLRTVRLHLKHARIKLAASTLHEAAAQAVRLRVVKL